MTVDRVGRAVGEDKEQRLEEMPELYREKRNEMKCIEGKGRRLRVSNIMIKG